MAASRDYGRPRMFSSLGRFSQLWQLPLFILSLGLFAYAAYLFIHPGPRVTLEQKITVAREYLKHDRPDAAREQLNRILEAGAKIDPDKEATIHLLLADSLEASQKQQKIGIPENYRRIIQQIELALRLGAQPDAATHRRLADSYVALDQPVDAIDQYRQAIALDPTHAQPMQRKLIELELSEDDPVNADVSLDEYLKSADLTDAERAWALDQKAGILIDRDKFGDARKLLADALLLDKDELDQGQFNYQLGYCAYRQGDNDEAERSLRLSRDQLRVRHPLDADASYLLGKIHEEKGDLAAAVSFYQVVLTSFPESKAAIMSRMERGLCRLQQGETDAGMNDLHDLTAEIDRKPARAKFKPAVIAGLQNAERTLRTREDFQSALEAMVYEQTLAPVPETGFFARLAQLYELRADQIEKSMADADASDKIRREQQAREFRIKAGDAYVAYSRRLTLVDDKGYAEALWKGIDLYDQAGNLQNVISALELFVAERPSDKLAPDALLRLGRVYQAAGLPDKAIAVFQRNLFEHPKSLAASKSAVPLAQAYIAKGADYYSKAEHTLLGVVRDNPLVDPSAEEFRQSLFELAQLYYRTGRYEEAVARLDELTQRYPHEERMPQLLFLMGDSYRKSAQLLDARVASASSAGGTNAAVEMAEAITARRDRLSKARGLFDRVIELYRAAKPTADLDKLYQKMAHFYRADCVYDLGDYQEAIKLYDAAAFNYQNDPSALSAYVQIVNAYCALGKPDEARAANNRAKWMLKHMPADAFQDGAFSMPRQYWDQWLQWTNDSGMW